MSDKFDLEEYLTDGVEKVVRETLKATFNDPKMSLFMMSFAMACKKASKRRDKEFSRGVHVPPFLIASITSECNLHCRGCYSRANKACLDAEAMSQLTAVEWQDIFIEARDLGVSFILLAGGEPTMRRDVIEMAGGIPEIIFPIFTNGTLLDEHYYEMFNDHRNLIPILSIEGKEENTDERRGAGTFAKLIEEMDTIKAHGLIFGISVTVTTKNLKEVTSNEFLGGLAGKGCRVVIFVEYVPVDDMNIDQVPGDEEREYMKERLADLRADYADDMVMISFPGDEKSSGGCLAAGRGFFHINSHGDAEPCPFSPYSDINVKDTSLLEALRSRLFKEIDDQGLLAEEHAGGCVLFERRKSVENLIGNKINGQKKLYD